MSSRSRNGKTVSSFADQYDPIRKAHTSISVLRHIEEEASTWIPKDRKWKKRRPQDEEAEANNTKEVAEQKNTDDKDSGDSEVPSQSAQQSDFY